MSLCGDFRHFTFMNRNVRMVFDFFRDQIGKCLSVHRKCAARFYARRIGTRDNQAACAAQLFLEQARRRADFRTAQRIGAAKLRKRAAVVRRCHFNRLHFVQIHMDTALCQLPSSFAARKACADHNGIMHQLVPP